MKKYLTVFAILISFNSFSQEAKIEEGKRENKGFFNITKISYIKAYEINRERFVSGEGNITSEPDASSTGARSLQTINGFFISENFSLGVGVGLDGYRKPTFNTLPVFVDIRFYLEETANSLFAFTDLGVALKLGETSSFDRGGIFNLGGGYRFPISSKINLISEVYFSHKSLSLTNEGLSTSDDLVRVNGIGFSLGIIF